MAQPRGSDLPSKFRVPTAHCSRDEVISQLELFPRPGVFGVLCIDDDDDDGGGGDGAKRIPGGRHLGRREECHRMVRPGC